MQITHCQTMATEKMFKNDSISKLYVCLTLVFISQMSFVFINFLLKRNEVGCGFEHNYG